METSSLAEDALTVVIPSADNLELNDSRRITGPGLLWGHPGAVLDVFFHDIDKQQVETLWNREARRVLDAIGWQQQHITIRHFNGGVNLAISAPIDQLHSAVFAAKIAWHFCASALLIKQSDDFKEMINDLQKVMSTEANPNLIELITAASEHGVDVLSDDTELSLGHGKGSQTWPINQLPSPEDIDWQAVYDIPIALITGTNGKTTTARLCNAIGKAAGLVSGLTSTEFVRVGDDILDHGDYSGPGGARMLLRDQRLEIAFLEVARGGILRRGLPLRQARVALVTNVAADHLGNYGVNTVEDLALAKFSVHRTLAKNGVLVLNADDELVVAEASRIQANLCWFSLNPNAAQITTSKAEGAPCAWLENSNLMYFDGKQADSIINVGDIPVTMGGAAQYNVRNSLGALCLSKALGLDNKAIYVGLSQFKSDPKDNPGRCNEFSVNGARVFVDFAHNPHSISAVSETMASIPAKKRFVMMGIGGDRSDQAIQEATSAALSLQPDCLVAVELDQYLRGRKLGDVSSVIVEQCYKIGMSKEQVFSMGSPLEGAELILNKIQPGDLALLLILADREKVFSLLEQLST